MVSLEALADVPACGSRRHKNIDQDRLVRACASCHVCGLQGRLNPRLAGEKHPRRRMLRLLDPLTHPQIQHSRASGALTKAEDQHEPVLPVFGED